MANRLPYEDQLYDRIRIEKISIDPFVWDTVYLYLGDYISAINMIVSFYVDKKESVPVDEARKILGYTRIMKGLIDKVLHHEKMSNENERLTMIKEQNMTMHPVVRELVAHHTGNDIYGINLIVSFYLDPQGEEPISVDHAQKIINYTLSMRSFLDRLRLATQQDIHSKG